MHLKIFNHFGLFGQIEKLKEEQLEIIDAIENGPRFNVLDELADNHVLLKQFQLLHEISDKELSERIDYKLNRTMERISTGYYKSED